MLPELKRKIALVLGLLGLLPLAAGSFLVVTRMRDLSRADGSAALANLARVELDRITSREPLAISLVIPDTPQWARIRRKWGEPNFLIAAVSSAKSSCYCIPKLPLTIAVIHDGDRIPAQPAFAPYGHSSECSMSALKFDAAPGTKLTISVTKRRNEPLPYGDLIIAGSWWNTKDKLVGIALDEELRNVATFAIGSGSALILLAGLLTWRRLG